MTSPRESPTCASVTRYRFGYAGGPNDATRFLSLELGEEIKGFSYGQAAARATLYFLIVLAVVWAFVAATREREA